MSRALDDIRVLDFTTTIAGPHCGRMLADLGAEVIKVESPDGDMMRTRPPLRDGASASFGQLNAGKKSIVLDLKRADAKEAARRLIATADVLVENFRPGVMRRLGLDYPSLAPDLPRLVYCAISGYGQTGPSADRPAYAPVVHAASGFDLAHVSYQDGRIRPDFCGVFIADVLSGTYAFGAVMSALHQRTATGRGQFIDVSMLESMLSLTLSEIQGAQFEVPPPGRPMFGPVATRDGYLMLVIASERTFRGAAAAAGRLDWLTDPRFAEYLTRRARWGELIDEFEQWSRTLDTQACLAALDAAGVPASAYRTVREALADPQLEHRRALSRIEDAGGSFLALNVPFRMSGADTAPRRFAAALGAHSHEVLGALGYSAAQVESLAGRA